jgi:gas vesicle protein
MSDERGSDTAGYLAWFFLGAVAGAAAALLLAPKTGRETRELLAEHSGDWLKKAQAAAGDAQVKASDLSTSGASVSSPSRVRRSRRSGTKG